MCGIYSSLSTNKILCSDFLISLKELEYRGYDSAGLVTLDKNKKYKSYKTLSKIDDLKLKISKEESSSLLIGHTRWATHGKPNIKNCHPHIIENLSIVHNGVVENYDDLKKNKIFKNVKFKTDTDTEMILLLIYNYCKSNSFINAVKKTIKLIKGSNAFVCSNIGKDINELAAYKNNTPLYFGIKNNGEKVFSSDVNAMSNSLKGYYYLDNNDIVHITNKNTALYNKKNKRIVLKKIVDSNFKRPKIVSSCYTYSEIKDQKKIISTYGKNIQKIYKVVRKIKKPNEINIIGCGSSYNAGLLAKAFLEKNSNIPTSVYRPSEFNFFLNNKNKLFIFISQSGETADICSLIESKKEFFSNSLSIVNNDDSRLVRESKYNINLNVGLERGVAATKTFSSQILVLNIISKILSKDNNNLVFPSSSVINKLFSYEKEIIKLSKKYSKFKNLFVLGRNYNFPIACEAALKIKEISYIHAEGAPSSEIKHGPIALFDNKFPVIFLVSNKKETIHSEISSLNEVISRTNNIFLIAPDTVVKKLDPKTLSKIDVIAVPDFQNDMAPILYLIILQLFSYHLAKSKKLNIDQPRNLAKVVTVE